MNSYIVYFEYFNDGEIGNDKYRFTDIADATDKMKELTHAIKVNFADCSNCETVDEPDFFGIIDKKSGDFAKVFMKEV